MQSGSTGPAVLRWEQVAVGSPGLARVRGRHVAVGLDFADTYFRAGRYRVPLPSGIGAEAAGVWRRAGRASRTSRRETG